AIVGAAARAHVQPSAGALPVAAVVPARRRHKHHHALIQDLAPVRDTLPQATPLVANEIPPADPRIDSGVTGGAVAPDEPPATNTSSGTAAQPTDGSGTTSSATGTAPAVGVVGASPASGSTA